MALTSELQKSLTSLSLESKSFGKAFALFAATAQFFSAEAAVFDGGATNETATAQQKGTLSLHVIPEVREDPGRTPFTNVCTVIGIPFKAPMPSSGPTLVEREGDVSFSIVLSPRQQGTTNVLSINPAEIPDTVLKGKLNFWSTTNDFKASPLSGAQSYSFIFTPENIRPVSITTNLSGKNELLTNWCCSFVARGVKMVPGSEMVVSFTPEIDQFGIPNNPWSNVAFYTRLSSRSEAPKGIVAKDCAFPDTVSFQATSGGLAATMEVDYKPVTNYCALISPFYIQLKEEGHQIVITKPDGVSIEMRTEVDKPGVILPDSAPGTEFRIDKFDTGNFFFRGVCFE